MLSKLSLGLAVVAVVIALFATFGIKTNQLVGSASNCTDGYTCFTNLETQGLSLMDATTTLADTVSLTNPALCFNFYATSTATQLHMTASTTGVLPNGAAAVLTANYGACAN